MQTRLLLLLCTALLLSLSLFSCEKDEAAPTAKAPDTVEERALGPCVNVKLSASAVPLGGLCLPAPLNVCGFGALPGPATVAGIDGLLSSVVTQQEVGSNGILHFKLHHYFDDGHGNTFWTQDVATCKPLDDSGTRCWVNDRLQIIGGTGVFAGAQGYLINQGALDFVNLTLDVNTLGKICASGL